MTETEFNSFMHGIKELTKTKKSNERIMVDVYDPYGRKLNNDEI